MKKNEEIDLIDLSIKLAIFLKKRFIIVLIFSVIGLIYGGVESHRKWDYYKTFFVAHSTNIPSDILINIIETIQLNLEEGNIDKITNDLSLNKEQAAELKGIEVELISTNTEGTLLKIDLEIKNGSNSNAIKLALENYVKAHNYIKERVNFVKSQQSELIKVLENKISQLNKKHSSDDDKPLILTGRKEEIFLLTNNYTYRELVDLYERKQAVEKLLQFSKEFEIIEDLSPLVKIHGLVKYLLIYGFLGLFTGILISLLLEFDKIVKQQR